VNGYAIGRRIAPRLLREGAEERGGTLVTFDAGSVRIGS
jgi:hypothetical protein